MNSDRSDNTMVSQSRNNVLYVREYLPICVFMFLDRLHLSPFAFISMNLRSYFFFSGSLAWCCMLVTICIGHVFPDTLALAALAIAPNK